MCVFLISPVPIAEPLTSELIDTPVFHNLAPRPIKYRVSVPIPTEHRQAKYTLGIRCVSVGSDTHKKTSLWLFAVVYVLSEHKLLGKIGCVYCIRS